MAAKTGRSERSPGNNALFLKSAFGIEIFDIVLKTFDVFRGNLASLQKVSNIFRG